MSKQQTALTKLINTFKESIDYLESSLEDVTDETTRIRLRARLSQARYFLNYANEAKEIEKEQMIEFAQEVFRNRYNQITQSLGNIADDIYKENYE
jgi:prophage DNA circulation protein